MTKSLLTVVVALAIALAVLQVLRPRGAAAAIQPLVEAPVAAIPNLALPEIQAPFDTTPITPVESTGAPMNDIL